MQDYFNVYVTLPKYSPHEATYRLLIIPCRTKKSTDLKDAFSNHKSQRQLTTSLRKYIQCKIKKKRMLITSQVGIQRNGIIIIKRPRQMFNMICCICQDAYQESRPLVMQVSALAALVLFTLCFLLIPIFLYFVTKFNIQNI